LGLYPTWIPGIGLSRDFERLKVPENLMKSPFCFVSFWGSNPCDYYFRAKTAEACKTLAEWPVKSTRRHLPFEATPGAYAAAIFGPNFRF
jgi:hypothetical protein